MSESQYIKSIKAYFNHDTTQSFYRLIWGGEDIHVGLYEDPSLTIRSASRETAKKMIELLPVSLDGNTRILDIGAGFGGAARYISWHYGCKVECLDVSEQQNAFNTKRINNLGLDQLVKVVEGNFEQIPSEDHMFDIVWSNDALMYSEDREKAIKEVNRVLRPGGLFIFTDILHGENAARGSLKPILEGLPVKELSTLKDYQKMFRTTGFEEERILEMPEHLLTHYNRVQQEIKTEKKQLISECGDAFFKDTLKGLSLWIRGAKKGYLNWGIFLYKKK